MKHLTTPLELAIANRLYAKAQYFGGCSVNAQFKEPTEGYLVSIKDGLVFDSISEVNEHAVSNWIVEHLNSGVNENLNYYFGSWKDKETNKIYFDVSLNTPSMLTALTLAEEFKQIAIYDIENKTDITTDI